MEFPLSENGDEVFASSANSKDEDFNVIIGHIEDIMIDENFERLQKNFMERHYQHFDEAEENKLEYTSIFKEYQSLIEEYLEKEILVRHPEFSMPAFINQLRTKRNELEGEVFEMLLSLSDFLIFKELMLDYKRVALYLKICCSIAQLKNDVYLLLMATKLINETL